MVQFQKALISVVSLIALTVSANAQPMPAFTWVNYSQLTSNPVVQPWIVVMCKFGDLPAVPVGLEQRLRQFFTQPGHLTGNLYDYWLDVSYGALAIRTSVSGWYTAPYTRATQPPGQAGRTERARQCAEQVPTADVDFADYYGVIVVMNDVADVGACSQGQNVMRVHGKTYNLGCLFFDPNSFTTGFAGQEMGHTFGLNHGYDLSTNNCGGAAGEYCDRWDVMSTRNAYLFRGVNPGIYTEPGDCRNSASAASGCDGPGLDAPNLLRMGWIPSSRIATYRAGDPDMTLTLAPLSHPEAPGALTARVILDDPRDYFTVEFRHKDGWDAGIPKDSVLIHEYKEGAPSRYSLLQTSPDPAADGRYSSAGMRWAPAAGRVEVDVKTITNAGAEVTIGAARLWPGGTGTTSIAQFNYGTKRFQQVPGELQEVKAGPGGVWGINSRAEIYVLNPRTGLFDQQIPGILAAIAVGDNNNIWGLNDLSGLHANNIFRFDQKTRRFTNVPGPPLTDIAAGSSGAWGLQRTGSTSKIFRFRPGVGFVQVAGALNQIAVGDNQNVWGINAASEIYHFNPSAQPPRFDRVPGVLRQVAVSYAGTEVWGLNLNGLIYRFNKSTQLFDQNIPGSLATLAVGDPVNVWGLSGSNEVYWYNAEAQRFDKIPTTLLTKITVGPRGGTIAPGVGGPVFGVYRPVQ